MIESRRSLAVETAAFILLILLAVILVPLLFAQPVTAHVPPGQDGTCHGANQASCRPDPQPSHGHDCDHPNIEPGDVGNDDHCSDPIVDPSTTPTGSIGDPLTGTPDPTGFDPPAVASDITPPPTSAATTPAVARSGSGWLSVLVLIVSAVVGLLTTLRRVRR